MVNYNIEELKKLRDRLSDIEGCDDLDAKYFLKILEEKEREFLEARY